MFAATLRRAEPQLLPHDEQVKLRCRLDGPTRTLLGVESERYSVGADGSAELYVYGTLTGNDGTGLTVTAEDSSTYSCAYPPGLDLAAFRSGRT